MTHEQLAKRIAEVALLRGEFTLRSGRKSNYYLDKYRFETQPDVLKALGEMFAKYDLHNIPCSIIPPEASGWFRKEIKTVADLKGLGIFSAVTMQCAGADELHDAYQQTKNAVSRSFSSTSVPYFW